MEWLLIFLFTIFYCQVLTEDVKKQQFRVKPKDLVAVEGTNATLECSIDNLSGSVQWVKDGFGLGFGYPYPSPGIREYMLTGDRSRGVYNLLVKNVTLDDDGDYQCQVGPANGQQPIRSVAKLSVIAPPSYLAISNHTRNMKVEKLEGEDIQLECEARDAKPAAQIRWYRNNVEITEGVSKDEIEEILVEANQTSTRRPATKPVYRYNTVSRLQMKALAKYDYADIICEARHPAVKREFPMRTNVQLSVLYPPGAPYIDGYTGKELFRRGRTVQLRCKSRGGNPPAQLIWYKNNEPIGMAYRSTGRTSENVLTFVADTSDNRARFGCEAKNIMIEKPLRVEIDLDVYYPPEQVTISGPVEGRIGDSIPLNCTTAPSNPAAVIKWSVNGVSILTTGPGTVVAAENGWISTSETSVVVEAGVGSMSVVCIAVNTKLAENVIADHVIHVLQPPSPPMITGYTPGTALVSGTVHKMACISTGGNPLATLTWYKNDKKIHSISKTSNRSVVSEMSTVLNMTDNQAQYRCEASSIASEIPQSEVVTLTVNFAPETVKVQSIPEVLTPGIQATLHCDGASSNPPAELTWWRDGIPVETERQIFKKGLHGGTVSSVNLKLNVTKDLNEALYTCQATNEVLSRSVHDSLKLNVLYPPVFVNSTETEVNGVEGEVLIIDVKASGNPDSITYTWTKDGLPITPYHRSSGNDRIVSEGGILNITRVSRHDDGVYTCVATNSQGSATINITVDVNYAATIMQMSQIGEANPDEDVILSCSVVGKPLTEDHVTWERENYDLDSKTISFNPKNGTSYLHIPKVSRSDVGYFNCVVDNGIGVVSRKEIMLMARFPPEIDTSPSTLKFGTNTGLVGKLECTAKSVPPPTFAWYRNKSKLPVNMSSKFSSEYRKTDPVTYVSTLLVNDVKSSDYGNYECEASNELGQAQNSMTLEITSAPDPVTTIKVLNVTHNSVTLSWEPGFNGGLFTWYRVRYRDIYEYSYKYEDVVPKNATTYTIRGLEKNTNYVFSVMSINDMGESRYTPDDVKATTLTSSEIGELNVVSTQFVEADVSKSVIIYVSIAAAVLVLVNAALVGCFVFKRRARRLKEQPSKSSKSGAIEMYAPSSYNDTITGETISSVSEKSEPYSDDNDDIHHIERLAPPIPEVPRHMISSQDFQQAATYLGEDALTIPVGEYQPPTYAAYEGDHARTLPHPQRQKEVSGHNTLGRSAGKPVYVPSPSPMPPLDGSYYNSSDRYLSYPPLIGDYLQQQSGRTLTPPQQYSGTTIPKNMLNTGAPATPLVAPPPHMYGVDMILEKQSAGGTLRRQRFEKMAVPPPPPDVTVLHPGNCAQHLTPAPVKQPQSILKDPSRHKYGNINNLNNQYGSPLSSSTPQSNSSQILSVHNLTSEVPQYGTIRKDIKKSNVTIDESYNQRNESQSHVV